MNIDIDLYTKKKVIKILSRLHEEIKVSFVEANQTALASSIIKKTPLTNELKEVRKSVTASLSYFPDEIMDHIINEQSTSAKYTFDILRGETPCTVTLYFVEFNVIQLNMKVLDTFARRVCAALIMLSKQAANNKCSSNLIIYVYLTEFKRTFPLKKDVELNAEHVNGGLSNHCSLNNELVVYRKEEWFKVLIHELFHAFGLSFIENEIKEESATMQKMLKKMYSISHEIKLYESYCEIWARILNGMFDCYLMENDKPSEMKITIFIGCVMEKMDENVEFSKMQCCKILNYMDITSEEIMNPTTRNVELVRNKYLEKTNVFAYYFITYTLLNSFCDFITWCETNNPVSKDNKRLMQFRVTPSNLNGFMELLYHCKQNCPKFETTVDNMSVLGSSMRMTPP